MRLKLALRTYIFLNLSDENSNILWHFVTAIIFGTRNSYLANEKNYVLQYVAQYPDGTSIRTLKTKTQFLRRPFQLSVNKVFRMKAEHFGFKMKVLASWKLAKQSQKTPFCSGE